MLRWCALMICTFYDHRGARIQPFAVFSTLASGCFWISILIFVTAFVSFLMIPLVVFSLTLMCHQTHITNHGIIIAANISWMFIICQALFQVFFMQSCINLYYVRWGRLLFSHFQKRSLRHRELQWLRQSQTVIRWHLNPSSLNLAPLLLMILFSTIINLTLSSLWEVLRPLFLKKYSLISVSHT